ncbi:MAG: hypothetical protein JRI70_03520, partial [Deltaproteobacteria bacterium]|nr:hypothetical protein [Deltaproteobacteria bacterium]
GSPEFAETIVFVGGGGYGPVGFTHMNHSTDYYGGNCLECHDHDEGVWSCQDCHTRGDDAEDLCEVTDDEHGCIMVQCQDCHVKNSPPAPNGEACGDCHGFPQYAETIVFPGGGNCESVTFTHRTHAMDYSEGRCRDCHKMEADFWMCRLCHTYGKVDRGPNDGNCEISDYSIFDPVHGAYHGCISYQCMKCHENYLSDDEYPTKDNIPDGSHCVDCHDSCGCPPPDGQQDCECSHCHSTYLLTHNDDGCAKPGCHAYEDHTDKWEPCTNDVCHEAHEAMDDWHETWQFGDGLCVNANCHTPLDVDHAFDVDHGGWACNYRCHPNLPQPLPGEQLFHDFDDNQTCIFEDCCHWPVEDYAYENGNHQTVDDTDDCVECHPNQPHSNMPIPLIDWATCGIGSSDNSEDCHGTITVTPNTPDLTVIIDVHERKGCNDSVCHWDYPPTPPHDEQGCWGLANGCHAINDYPFDFSDDNASHDTWDPCANDYCHPLLLP